MNRSYQILIACCIWSVIALAGVAVFRFIIFPHQKTVEIKKQEEQHKQTIQQTSADSRYKTQINFSIDSFSGYSVFRSDEFQNELSQKKIKVNFIDDKADYTARLKALKNGESQLAVFTIDALVKASSELKDLPATIVAVVDETRGADAMLGFSSTFPNIDSINNPNVKFILTPNSPSETLARVVISHFGLNNLNKDSFVFAQDADDVYHRYRNAKPTDQQVYVLWEPYATKMIENPNVQVIVDSSRFRGYIVDVIVCNRDFLIKNESTVVDFVEAYFRAFHLHSQKMTTLVSADAQKSGTPLSEKQITRLTNGIWWKNTSENYAHFGLNNDRPLQHLEDMLQNVTNVLVSTGAIDGDPTQGKYNLLYYDKVLGRLKDNNFHPGVETIRKDNDDLPVLAEAEWKKLIPVGTLQVPTLVFARGTSRITESSEIVLNELIEKLKSWPQYYLLIKGNASTSGDIEANKALALQRAKAVEKYILEHGVSNTRVRAVSVEPSGETSVVFQLGYTPY